MRRLDNIEKLPGRTYYTGYADGAWRIKRDGSVWCATKMLGAGYETAPTLARLSQKLAMYQFQATIATVKD